MNTTTRTCYRPDLGFLLLKALWFIGRRKWNLSKTISEKPPTGSVAPLY